MKPHHAIALALSALLGAAFGASAIQGLQPRRSRLHMSSSPFGASAVEGMKTDKNGARSAFGRRWSLCHSHQRRNG